MFLALSFNAVTAVSRPVQPAAAEEITDEAHFVGLINELRAEQGLTPLQINPELTRESREWAVQLRADDELSHAADLSVGITTVWLKLGENVGVGPVDRIDDLFDAFVASPDHLANLLDPSFEAVGVGVVYDDDGRLWTTHRFMDIDNTAIDNTTTDDPAIDNPATDNPATDDSDTSVIASGGPDELAAVDPSLDSPVESAVDSAGSIKNAPRTEPTSLADSGTTVDLDEDDASDLFDLLAS